MTVDMDCCDCLQARPAEAQEEYAAMVADMEDVYAHQPAAPVMPSEFQPSPAEQLMNEKVCAHKRAHPDMLQEVSGRYLLLAELRKYSGSLLLSSVVMVYCARMMRR